MSSVCCSAVLNSLPPPRQDTLKPLDCLLPLPLEPTVYMGERIGGHLADKPLLSVYTRSSDIAEIPRAMADARYMSHEL